MRISEKGKQIIAGVRAGKKNREIAANVGTTEQVVKNYLRRIYEAYGVSSRHGLMAHCFDVEQGKKFDPYSVFRGDPSDAGLLEDSEGTCVYWGDYSKLCSIWEEACIELNRLRLVVASTEGVK